MKYYLIVGETSGELHASRLMASLKKEDPEADFRFIGGDRMAAVGGTLVRHYKYLAYMGFIPVLRHLPTILKGMSMVKRDITQWQPDVVILVDYAGFNLSIAKYLHKNTNIPVYYYISPKIWAWKEWRIKDIKRDVDEMFSILPFEVPFYQKKHHYPIHYVGNPTADEVRTFLANYKETEETFVRNHHLATGKPIIALLPGSRKQEIKDNLPAMAKAATAFAEYYQPVIACAPNIEQSFYDNILTDIASEKEKAVKPVLLKASTYSLLAHSTAALVTSGTATLETSLFNVPQVVCYETPLPRLIRFAFNHIIKVKYISLVNLIADKEIVPELLADRFTIDNIRNELQSILPGGTQRQSMLNGYKTVKQRLGEDVAPEKAARVMVCLLKIRNSKQ